jgi:hypothetical protein
MGVSLSLWPTGVYVFDRSWRCGYRPLKRIERQPYMTSRTLRDGSTAYYWRLPAKARREGYPIYGEALGCDFVQACLRAEMLNALYEAFRSTKCE